MDPIPGKEMRSLGGVDSDDEGALEGVLGANDPKAGIGAVDDDGGLNCQFLERLLAKGSD
jgi:hypothetical protein